MRKLISDAKGAVTIFVTMLLIPAILVSGTAVDITRIHSAQSVIHDANQLAANSVLTQYNALLYDLYGLMGVAEDDPILGALLNEYINAAVFGADKQSRGLGTLQLFYGAQLSTREVEFADSQHLRDTEVLKRQIEEYMKIRGPVLLVQQFIGMFSGNNLKQDADLISEKLEIDSGIADMYDKYKELYDAIVATNDIDKVGANGGFAGPTIGTVSSGLAELNDQFQNLRSCYAKIEELTKKLEAENGETEISKMRINSYREDIADYGAKYKAILENIKVSIVGGRRGNTWAFGGWLAHGNTQGLNKTIENAKNHANEKVKPKLDAVLGIARELDAANAELSRKIDELENKINTGQCSDELKKGMTERTGSPPMSAIERYRDILKWNDISGMAGVFRDGGYDFIDNVLIALLDGVKYRDSANPSAASMTREEMANITSDSGFDYSRSIAVEASLAGRLASIPRKNVSYGMPQGYKPFAEHSPENKSFYDALAAMLNQPQLQTVKMYDGQKDESGKDAEKKQENVIKALFDLVEKAYVGLTNSPIGAKYLESDDPGSLGRSGVFGMAKSIPETMNSDAMKVMFDPSGALAKAADYTLLLTYCTSMFSNYTTSRPATIGKSKDDMRPADYPRSITGVPISPEINYFFQSEWEYLYNGEKSASKNLNAITGLIFLVRFICNYITVFSVKEVTMVVNQIYAAFAWNPPLGVILGELARAAFVAAETLIDVAVLRMGHRLPLIKSVSRNEWVCSPSGLLNALENILIDGANAVMASAETGLAPNEGGEDDEDDSGSNADGGNNADGGDGSFDGPDEDIDGDIDIGAGKGLSYENYMVFFFVAKAVFNPNASAELVKRSGDLIELNIINYLSKSAADESKMAEAMKNKDRFRLINMKTDFSITTTAEMRMLFLSLPFARKGINGTSPPSYFALSATDYRGY